MFLKSAIILLLSWFPDSIQQFEHRSVCAAVWPYGVFAAPGCFTPGSAYRAKIVRSDGGSYGLQILKVKR